MDKSPVSVCSVCGKPLEWKYLGYDTKIPDVRCMHWVELPCVTCEKNKVIRRASYMLDKPEKPSNYCFYCHQPFEYEWYEFDPVGREEGEPEGFWQELSCQECFNRRAELAEYLKALSDEGKLELDARDKEMIKEAELADESKRGR